MNKLKTIWVYCKDNKITGFAGSSSGGILLDQATSFLQDKEEMFPVKNLPSFILNNTTNSSHMFYFELFNGKIDLTF